MIKPREIQLNAKAVGVRDQRYTFCFAITLQRELLTIFRMQLDCG